MGNSNSQSLQLNEDNMPPPHMRDQRQRRNQKFGPTPSVKVLPEEITSQKLRPTEQGAILQTHGTINPKKAGLVNDHVIIPREFSKHYSEREVILEGVSEDEPYHPHTIIEESPAKARIKLRKKYKAPSPPDYDSSDPGFSPEISESGHELEINKNKTEVVYAKPVKKHLRLFKSKQDSKGRRDSNPKELPQRSVSEERYTEERTYKTGIKSKARSTECLSIDVVRQSGNKYYEKGVPGSRVLSRTISEEASTLSSVHSSKHSGGSRDRAREPSSIDRWIGMSTEPRINSLPYKKDGNDVSAMEFKSLDRRKFDSRHSDNGMDFVGELHEAIKRRQSYTENRTTSSKKDQIKQFYFGMPSQTFTSKTPEREVHTAIVHVSQSKAEYVPKPSGHPETYPSPSENKNTVDKETIDYEFSNVSTRNKQLSHDLDKFASRLSKTSRKVSASPSDPRIHSDRSSSEHNFHGRHDSGSYYISQSPSSEDEVRISMNVRPTIPRKKFDIPRFSPSAAWKSLSLDHLVYAMQSEQINSHSSDEGTFTEEKIRHTSRPLPPFRSSTEKSGDSGISGDAGSPGLITEFEQIMSLKSSLNTRPLAMSSPVTTPPHHALNKSPNWTPEHDLEGESMGDGSFDQSQPRSKSSQGAITPPKLLPRGFMFSQSLANGMVNSSYDSSDGVPNKASFMFKKNKAADSGQSSLSKQRRYKTPKAESPLDKLAPSVPNAQSDSNWLLSRSVPSLLNQNDSERLLKSLPNISTPLVPKTNHMHDDFVSLPSSHKKNYQKKNHIVYLPEYKALKKDEKIQSRSVDRTQRGHDKFSLIHDKQIWSTRSQPDLVSGNVTMKKETRNPLNGRREQGGKKGKKFSYQSTYRQQELKKLELKLSKEAEEKEKQRVNEMELIRQVEEEFKKKREGEKVNLRHQLRLFQLEQTSDRRHEQELQENFVGVSSSSRSREDPPKSSGKLPPSKYVNRYNNRQRVPSAAHMYPPELSIPDHCDKNISIISSASSPSISPASSKDNSGLLSNFTKWVKNKHSKGSLSSSTAESSNSFNFTRQDPEGAPSQDLKKVKEEFRREIIAASRVRSGGESSPDEDRRLFQQEHIDRTTSNRKEVNSGVKLSPETERAVKEIIPRSCSPARKPHSRNVSTSSTEVKSDRHPKLTQELSEFREERREYKDYWRIPESRHHRRPVESHHEAHRGSSPKVRADVVRKSAGKHPAVICEIPGSQFHSLNASSQTFCDAPKAPVSDNYRRDFAQGMIHSDRSEKQDSGGREFQKSSRTDSSHDTVHSHGFQSVSTDSPRRTQVKLDHEKDGALMKGFVSHSPARFAVNVVQPFHHTTGYRPVAFSPIGGKNIASPVS